MDSFNILIADDHEVVRRGVRSLLSSCNWNVCGEASNGVEAIEKARTLRPDLVLMDVSMPEMDGVKATRTIHRELPDIHIILISQNDAGLMRKMAIDSGAEAFISKSKISEDLLGAVAALARKRNGGRRSTASNGVDADAQNQSDQTGESTTGFFPGEIMERDRATSLLAAIVDSSDDAIISKNLDGTITSWNKAAERLFGYSAKEAIGRHITLIIPPERRNEEEKILRQLRRGERVDHFETVRVRKDGTTVDLSLTISPVRDSEGRVIGASKVARDITERKLAERALHDSEEKFRNLSASLDAQVRTRTGELEERNTAVLRQSDLLRDLSRRLLQAQDEERRHIARDLHDHAGQTLTVLGINLAQLVQKAARSSPQLAIEAEKIQQTVQQLHREIRTATYLLHPPLLDESGLCSALEWYTEGLAERSGLEIILNIADDFGRLPREMELAVFRVVQECLTNIHRHSGSKLAAIRLARQADHVTIEVQDRGKGITSERLAEVQARGAGLGIRGMRERLRQFGGNLEIDSGPQGTTITVKIPLPAHESQGGPRHSQPAKAAV